MKRYNHIPDNLTPEQYAKLDEIADRIMGQGEDAAYNTELEKSF